VRQYSKCHLTKKSDKLVAISGIARYLSILGGPQDYIAGLWRQTLLPGLLWRCSELGITDVPAPGVRPSQYVAPSWSWASVNGSINFRRYVSPGNENLAEKYVVMVRLIDIFLDHLTDDPYGELKGACIRLAGRLRRVSYGKVRPTHERPYFDPDGSLMISTETNSNEQSLPHMNLSISR
jgi:hypothetical protein